MSSNRYLPGTAWTSVLLVLGAIAAGCTNQGAVFAPSDAILGLSADDSVVPVDGGTIVQVTLAQADGSPAADGTEVTINATTGKLQQTSVRLSGGRAALIYKAAAEPGTDRITATSGDVTAQLDITVTSSRAGHVTLVATPALLPTEGGSAALTVSVTTPEGAPLAGARVVLTTTAGLLTPSEVSTGPSGEATAQLDTTAPAIITATVDGAPPTSIDVDLQQAVEDPIILGVNASPSRVEAGELVTFTIDAIGGAAPPTGTLTATFGDGGEAAFEFRDERTLTYAYQREGGYNATFRLEPETGPPARETVRVTVVAPAVPLVVRVIASPDQPVAGETVSFSIEASGGPAEPPAGLLTASFGDGEAATFDFRGQLTVPYVYASAGGYNATFTLDPTTGTPARETVRVTVAAPPPSAPPPPPPPPPREGADELDLGQVVWLNTDVSGWAQTSTITHVSIGAPPICIEHTKAGRWPVVDGLEGNPWIFANLDGVWYGATYEWLRSGQICKSLEADELGAKIKQSPLDRWEPRSGETIGLMVSTHARFGPESSVLERSNVVLVTWP